MLKTKTISTIKKTFSSTLNKKYDELQTIYSNDVKEEIVDYKDIEYNAIRMLTPIKSLSKSINYDICVYSIKIHDNKPFIQFYFYNNNNENIKWIQSKKFSKTTISGLTNQLKQTLNTNITFKGSFTYKQRNQLWFENTSDTLKPIHVKLKDKYISCLVSEIINIKKYLTIDIQEDVRSFFLDHSEFIYLYNKHNNPYEIPEVGFYGSYYKKIGIAVAIGHARNSRSITRFILLFWII